jgi:hypothetical protein
MSNPSEAGQSNSGMKAVKTRPYYSLLIPMDLPPDEAVHVKP